MRLMELNPRFYDSGGPAYGSPRRIGVGLRFDCPCGCGVPSQVEFRVALDGKPWRKDGLERTGRNFNELTLSPSIRWRDGCRWSGWIREGEVITC